MKILFLATLLCIVTYVNGSSVTVCDRRDNTSDLLDVKVKGSIDGLLTDEAQRGVDGGCKTRKSGNPFTLMLAFYFRE